MMLRHFATRAELERQMAAARQLRAETLGGAAWTVRAVARAIASLRRWLYRPTVRQQRRDWASLVTAGSPNGAPGGFWS